MRPDDRLVAVSIDRGSFLIRPVVGQEQVRVALPHGDCDFIATPCESSSYKVAKILNRTHPIEQLTRRQVLAGEIRVRLPLRR